MIIVNTKKSKNDVNIDDIVTERYLTIACVMINMKYNMNLFNCETHEFIELNTPFNIYENDFCEYNIDLSYGNVIILADEILFEGNIDHASRINKTYSNLIDLYKINKRYKKRLTLCESTHNTILSTVETKSNTGNCFIWSIDYVCSNNYDITPYIPEYYNGRYDKYSNSAATILFDVNNIIDLPNLYKSIDFPRRDKYLVIEDKQILKHRFNISIHSGALYEFYTTLMPDVPIFIYSKEIYDIHFIKYEQVRDDLRTIKFRKISKISDMKYLIEPYNGRCSYTNTELFGDFYIIDIYEFNNERCMFRIPICPFAYHYMFSGGSLRARINRSIKYIIYRSKINKTFSDVLSSMNATDTYKQILYQLYNIFNIKTATKLIEINNTIKFNDIKISLTRNYWKLIIGYMCFVRIKYA